MDLYEIRNTTKKLLREGTPTSVEYEKALPLCKDLFDAFPETHDFRTQRATQLFHKRAV